MVALGILQQRHCAIHNSVALYRVYRGGERGSEDIVSGFVIVSKKLEQL